MHGEARPQHCGLAVFIRRRGAVARRQPPAMGFDDLLGDGEAEPGILAEILLRPVGIEAFEYLLQGVGPDTRPLLAASAASTRDRSWAVNSSSSGVLAAGSTKR